MTARILVVDDEPDVQELFRQNFRREIRTGDYRFDFAFSGETALDVLEGQTRSERTVVLSDVNMPGMSGIELLAEIRKAWPEIQVFVVTAYGDSATEAKARRLGAAQFVPKPVDFAQLKHDLSSALERRP